MNARKPRPSKSEHEQDLLDEALAETFPASDPPAMVEPGGGITGAEDAREQPRDDCDVAPAGKSKRPGGQSVNSFRNRR
jgi:hypothetical protein